MALKRKFTTVPTYKWSYPMCAKAPDKYDILLQQASHETISITSLERFVKQFQGIDVLGSCSAVHSLKKLCTGDTKYKNRSKITKSFPRECHYFSVWCESSDKWKGVFQFSNGCELKVFMDTNFYQMWDALHEWLLYRQAQTQEKTDNGWYRHAIRLCARYQYHSLTGECNWSPETDSSKKHHN